MINFRKKIYDIKHLLEHPIQTGKLELAYSAGLISKHKLVEGAYYYGICRNADIAMWNGAEFVYLRQKFNSEFEETIKCPEDDDGFDVFIAVAKLEI